MGNANAVCCPASGPTTELAPKKKQISKIKMESLKVGRQRMHGFTESGMNYVSGQFDSGFFDEPFNWEVHDQIDAENL